jgi:uncharacterized protein
MNLILMHARGSSNKINFYKFLEDFCKQNKIEFFDPKVIYKEAKCDKWLKSIEVYKDFINENTIMVGHSMGCIALSKFLSRNPEIKIHSLHLVAGWNNAIDPETDNKSLSIVQGTSFDPNSIDWELISRNCGRIYIYYSRDDKEHRIRNSQKYKVNLGKNAKLIELENYGHFDIDNIKFPELVNNF